MLKRSRYWYLSAVVGIRNNFQLIRLNKKNPGSISESDFIQKQKVGIIFVYKPPFYKRKLNLLI